jgi:transcriptional antiterminator Rof (Rho-off)
MSDYTSIACIEHERLEFAVLRRQKLLLRLRDETGNIQTLTVLPTDVATREQAEWLTYRDESGAIGVVRLDRIESAVPVV